ncbi:MAG: MBL fold metallo-hydrolase [Anaerolineae bacterium]|nr:MBL fold metallo-hydrolase [Anaerolineae bacterium]
MRLPPNRRPVELIERTFPSANMAIIRGPRPILIDPGFATDAAEVEAHLDRLALHPRDLQCIALTHYHCDHNGAVEYFQQTYGVPIAAERTEAAAAVDGTLRRMVSRWYVQPAPRYTVDVYLDDGMVLETGGPAVQAVATPGHTVGHLSFVTDEGTLIAGDTFHASDVAPVTPFREGATSLHRLIESIHRLLAIDAPVRRALSGHGPLITAPVEAMEAALERLDTWVAEPERAAWHALKRLGTYNLILTDGMTERDFTTFLLQAPWFVDYAKHAFDTTPQDFVTSYIAELKRANAVVIDEGVMRPTTPYHPPPPGWLAGDTG